MVPPIAPAWEGVSPMPQAGSSSAASEPRASACCFSWIYNNNPQITFVKNGQNFRERLAKISELLNRQVRGEGRGDVSIMIGHCDAADFSKARGYLFKESCLIIPSGALVLMNDSIPYNGKNYTLVDGMVSYPVNSNLGVGSRLIEFAAGESDKRGCNGRLYLESLPSANGFYEKLGFSNTNVKVGENTIYLLDPNTSNKWVKTSNRYFCFAERTSYNLKKA